ncbi:MAG: LamG domain-containing protein, partial [Candidatus Dojkabacteria bacterium]
MFPAAQKTFKTKQKYSTNNNLGKRLHFFFDKNKTLSIIILASLILCLLSFTFLHLRRVQPNSNIRSLASHSKAILENKNPNFNVFFGERNTPDKQWVRFEAKASSENPFEESQKGFFGQILDTVRPKRVLGIELSLEQAGTEKVKTSTEFIENVEPKEGDNPYTSSQKPHVLNTDVVDGIDIEYQILEGLGLKEDIIIKDLDLYTKECEDITTCDLAFNEFVFNLKLDDGLILKRAWYTYKGKNTETYYFTDERGNYIGHFLPSWAIDSNGVKTHDIDIKVEEEKGNLKVKVVIDNDWLFSEERIFPIRIDPTIVHDTEIDFGAGSFVNTEYITTKGLAISSRGVECVGGTISEDGDYIIHTFNSNGTFYCDGLIQADVLIIGGGGGGGKGLVGGGGGAGGLLYISSMSITAGAKTVTVGNGGAARADNGVGNSGGNSSFNGTTALGGGGGGFNSSTGASGGSGGGGSAWATSSSYAGGAGTSGQGKNGGVANAGSAGAGGGGAGAVGGSGGGGSSGRDGGAGGAGVSNSITGTSIYYAGGGGGSGRATGSQGGGGNGGGGAAGGSGTNGLGGGGGSAAAGGSGVVIIRYKQKPSYRSGHYISPNIDFESNATLESLSWTSEGVNTGDGEIPYNDDGLVAQWNFNNTSGTTLTNNAGSCGTFCNATLSNFSNTSGQDVAIGSGWTNIHRRWGNGALMFDGVDDYATLNSNSSLRPANNFSVEAWVKVSNNTDFNIIITHADNGGGDDGWTLRVADTGRAQFYATNLNGFSNQNIQSNTLIELNEWYYLVGVYDNSVLKIYVNGILDNTKIAQGDVRYEVTDYVTIGRRGGTASPNTQFFHGTIDVIRFSQRVLSPSEILSNYQAGNIEFQYRDSGNDGEWVGGSEEVIDNFENNSGWQSTNENTLQKDSTEYSIEGSYALKLGGGYNYNIDSNTVGYWTLDETGGNLAYIRDSSGNNNHGTPTGTTYTSGKIGGARSFNGSSDSITTGTSARPSNNFTVETWFTTNVTHEIDTESTSGAGGTSGQKYLFGAMYEGTNAGMGVSVGTNGISVYEHGDSYMPALAVYNGPVPVGWNHLAVTYINKTPRIYLNGKLVRTGLTSTKSNIYAPYHIGGGPYGNHSGDIDEVRISNIARTPEEIAESYRLGKDHYVNKTLSSSIDLTDRTMIPFWVASDRLGSNLEFTYGNSKYVNNQPDANTVGLWRLDEESGSGAYLLDSSGNNNHGTPTGTTYTSGKIGGARSFNGSIVTPSYITMLRPSGVNNVLTVSLWFKTASTARGVLVDFSDSQPFNTPNAHLPILLIQSDGKIRAEYWTGTLQDIITSSTIVNDGNWHHISFVGNTSSQSLYIDGRLEGTRSGTIDNSWWIYTSLGVGYDTVDRGSQVPNSWNTSYNGLIDEFHISNIARTPTEIRQAYEMGRRTHPIVVTFNANLKSTNLITGDDDLSFDITTDSIENIDKGEKIIIKENYNGTEYIAQGDIETINKSTGAITVSSWDSGSTSPHYGIHSIGFSTNATVFKWQKEYIDIRFPLPEDKDNISQLTFRKTTNEGTTFWIDDMKKAKYLTDSSGSTF